jgi:predicted phosphodiesterase
MRIGIISDTHGLLRPEVIESLDGCEAILHGGDINKQEIIDQLERSLLSMLYVVTTIRSGRRISL